ncbi:MAG: C69 family dipeptidase [Myxococcales bacterium]|nr:C69 family dipeptidase [Myxococcales bacterium]
MCDSVVIVRPGEPVWLAKNSDRVPDEVQLVDWVPAAVHPAGAELRCTHLTIPQVPRTHAMILSRPRWMWGCEMGINAAGVAVANEAVFTRVPVAERGLTGMDLQRLALERAATAAEAVEVILALLASHAQGGGMGGGLRYHSSFIVADGDEAWILETAGELWALQKVRGVRSISNALTIDADFDRIHPHAYTIARDHGWCRSAEDFSFARAFGSRFYGLMSGARPRASCTAGIGELLADSGVVGLPGMATLLRDHGGGEPATGWRMRMPCAHGSYLPTRTAGQTTASMIARLSPDGPKAWMTGTSAPCLSVFKPVVFGGDCLAELPAAADEPEDVSLWWRHERLHRATILDYERRRRTFEGERAALEAAIWDAAAVDVTACRELWARHHAALPEWTTRALAVGRAGRRPFTRFWAKKAREAGLGRRRRA